MNQEIKTEWLAELAVRQQGVGKLRRTSLDPGDTNTQHCCLGVLCEVAARHDVGHWDAADEFIAHASIGADRSSFTLPRPIVRWAELDEYVGAYGAEFGADQLRQVLTGEEMATLTAAYGDNPATTGIPVKATLTSLNDSGISFATIAKLIEKYL